MNLYILGPEAEHAVDVRVTTRREEASIAIIYDLVLDERTPLLSPDEARALARRLTLAAEEVERA